MLQYTESWATCPPPAIIYQGALFFPWLFFFGASSAAVSASIFTRESSSTKTCNWTAKRVCKSTISFPWIFGINSTILTHGPSPSLPHPYWLRPLVQPHQCEWDFLFLEYCCTFLIHENRLEIQGMYVCMYVRILHIYVYIYIYIQM